MILAQLTSHSIFAAKLPHALKFPAMTYIIQRTKSSCSWIKHLSWCKDTSPFASSDLSMGRSNKPQNTYILITIQDKYRARRVLCNRYSESTSNCFANCDYFSICIVKSNEIGVIIMTGDNSAQKAYWQ
jgi:hypothetical protein